MISQNRSETEKSVSDDLKVLNEQVAIGNVGLIQEMTGVDCWIPETPLFMA